MPHEADSITQDDRTYELRRLGDAFICHFMRLLQLAKIHEAGNCLTIHAAEQFVAAGRQLLEHGDDGFTVEARRGRFFVNGERLLMQKQNAVYILSLLGWFEQLELYGLRFHRDFYDVTPQAAYQFVGKLMEAARHEQPAQWLGDVLAQERFSWVEKLAGPRVKAGNPARERAEMAYRIYSYAYNSVKTVGHEIIKNHSAGVRKPLRVIQDITDLVFVDRSVLMGAATIRDYDDYTFTHSVNVAILSICLGHQIGLSRNSLVRLGICALFHDLGKVDIPIGILNKPGPLDSGEFREIQSHSLNSVRRIIKLEADSELVAKIILPPFEHHLRYDLSGYPKVKWSRPLSLFGRIIQICDVYDALTSSRIYRPQPLSPDRALGAMLEVSGRDFDPVLLKWFINMHGIMPVGTLVKLNTGQLGLVCSGGDFRQNSLPQVLLLQRQNGGYKKGPIVELNQHDPETGRYFYTIESTHHPAESGIQPADFLM
ncbi:MAG: HD-GYP domain-containing protein [Thermodesulfobacteriota bacterium]